MGKEKEVKSSLGGDRRCEFRLGKEMAVEAKVTTTK